MQFSEAGQFDITTNPRQIIDSNHAVYVAKITNLSTVDVYLGFNSSVSPNTGDLLVGIIGSFLIIECSSSLYAVASASAKISFLLVRQN